MLLDYRNTAKEIAEEVQTSWARLNTADVIDTKVAPVQPTAIPAIKGTNVRIRGKKRPKKIAKMTVFIQKLLEIFLKMLWVSA